MQKTFSMPCDFMLDSTFLRNWDIIESVGKLLEKYDDEVCYHDTEVTDDNLLIKLKDLI